MAGEDRFEWIARMLDIRASDRILEIGAGSSPSAAYLAAGLRTGTLVVVDRSATAIARSAKKHAALLDSGRLHLVHADVPSPGATALLRAAGGPFDRILACNVNLFWTRDADGGLAMVRELLAPGGILYLVYGYGGPDDPPESPKPAPDKLFGHLSAAGFDQRVVHAGDLLCVIATPRGGE